MARTVTPEDLFSIMNKYEERIARLERALVLGTAGSGGGIATVVWAGSWPSRPSGFTQVMWIGGTTSPPGAVDGDIWISERSMTTLSARHGGTMSGSAGSNVPYTNASITLTSGRWLVSARISCSTNTPDAVAVGIWNQTAGSAVANSIGPSDTCPSAGYTTDVETETEMTVATNTQICPYGCRNGSSILTIASGPAGSPTAGHISALRLGP